MRSILLCTLVITMAAGAAALRAQETASIPTADGFQCPVGPNGTGEGYYIARGYRPNGHLGDDWNGTKGGDTDYGDPVYATAHGIVVYAQNYHVGWGNVVIIRHAFYEGLSLKFVDSLYGHLRDFNVQPGHEVKRGQLIGHIGNNNGMYDAHLHFEMRKNIEIGMYRGSFPRDDSNYYEPNRFLAAHLSCAHGGKTVSVPINTFPATPPPAYVANKVETPMYSPGSAPASHLPPVGVGSLRLSRESAPPPPPAPTPPPRVVVAPVTEPKAPPTPAPTPKVAATASTASKNSSKGSGGTAAKVTATPEPKSSTAAAASTKGATTASAKASPTPASGKKSATAAAKTAATPAPAGKTATTAAARTPSPSTKGATGDPASKTPPLAPIASRDPAAGKAPPAEAALPKPDPNGKASLFGSDAYEPATPPPKGSAIRRSNPGFRVDRFQDLRGMGY